MKEEENKLSKCCKAEVKTSKKNPKRGETVWYICTICNKPCDLYDKEEDIKQTNNMEDIIQKYCEQQGYKLARRIEDNLAILIKPRSKWIPKWLYKKIIKDIIEIIKYN